MDNQFIYCPKCGTRNFLDDNVCGICQADLTYIINTKRNIQATTRPTNYKAILLLIVSIVIFYYTFIKEDKNQKETTTSTSTGENNTLYQNSFSKNYLLSTVQEFKDNFNLFSKKYNLGQKINKLNVQKGQVNNSFMYMLTRQVGLVGTINKNDNSLTGITMVGQGNGTLKSGVNIIATMLCIIGSVDPTLEGEERQSIMDQLGLLDGDVDFYNLSNNTMVNGIQYFVNSNHQIGIMCGAKVPE